MKLPEPDDTYCGVKYYTEAQVKQAVRDALEAAAQICKERINYGEAGALLCERAIRNVAKEVV